MNAPEELSTIPNCVRSLAGRPRKIKRSELAPYVRCKCSVCLWCQDNAKWDRVFEKFVDPTYYSRPLGTAIGSPLSGL
jgi:hypothetical protein